MADETPDQPGTAGDTSANSDSNGSAKPAAPPVYTKEELTRIVAREVAKASSGRSELEQRLAAIEEERRVAEEAKLSATQRAELERKREQIVLNGDLPSPMNPPAGCVFSTRCWKAQAKCFSVEPVLQKVGQAEVACHFPE